MMMIGHYGQWVREEPEALQHIKGSGSEWYISSMLYSQDIPFWLEPLISCLCCCKVCNEDNEDTNCDDESWAVDE